MTAHPPTTEPLLMTVADVAQLLQVTGRTVNNLVRAGRLPAPLRLGHHPRWHREQLLQWLAVQADAAASEVAR